MKLIVLKNNVPLNEVSVETTDVHEIHEIYVGRSEDCHVQIDDPLISRHHFVISGGNLEWNCEKITQLGVVTLNGSLVTKNTLKNGDEIKFGSYSMLITGMSEAAQKKETIFPNSTPQDFQKVEDEVMSPLPAFSEESGTPVGSKILSISPIDRDEQDPGLALENLSDAESLDQFSSESSENDYLSEHNEVAEEFGVKESENQDFNEMNESLKDNFENVEPNHPEVEETQLFKSFVKYQLLIFGEYAPYDRFHIDKDEIYIGRDEKSCLIMLNDPEVSTVHAVIRKIFNEITLEDLNSSNGTILNGERINKATLTVGDEFVIGNTSFTLEVRSDIYESESERLMPIESGQFVETEEFIDEEIAVEDDMNFDSGAPPEKSIIKRIWKDPVKRKKTIYIIAVLTLVWVLFSPDEELEQSAQTKNVDEKVKAPLKNIKTKAPLSKELLSTINIAYELGLGYFDQARFDLAQVEFQKVVSIDTNFKNVQTFLQQTNDGLRKLQEVEAEKRAEQDRIKLKKVIDEFLLKAREAVKAREVMVAESLFSQIIEKDPENIEVSQLKLELDAWQKDEEKKLLEKAAKEAARKKMVDALSPGKTFYLKKEWYKAILKLEEFLRTLGLDEDLIKEASVMLGDSKTQLSTEFGPVLAKARSLKEGQDLKASYESFLEALRIDPTNLEALSEIDDIRNQLDSRSKKIYREAIIAESLSLFNDAKEKFLEVQQISPTDSEYYKKASEKLKNYLE